LSLTGLRRLAAVFTISIKNLNNLID